ncbi:MAG TPA: MvdD family ATP-grasp ribosomal peptide maturase [Paraburkholderia sp.]|uniref:MvdD family ATP-grasp ribosomal peptide maturase n=1 Tax=Paraburkholderia sp. TaxID=1926495 RepID=UPI002B494461|nr:MvdD family ATP-grasp ribosomal peptide maturase [Paraburkholderia sp.]HKR44400.1 MvdD family ATP-grasp ribosomal peptide maturase [Paraburkholderia sp.]
MSERHPRPVVLIITHSNDNESIPLVMKAVAAQGGMAYRFDTNRFPTDIQLSSHYSGDEERQVIACEDYELDLGTVSAVWYRRIAIGQCIPEAMDRQLRRAAIDQSRATLQGMIASLDAFHLDPVHRLRRADNKQLQLKIAREVGLTIPRTLITNAPDAVRSFARECKQGMIMKTLSSFAIYEQCEQKVVFTSAVHDKDLERLDDLRYCPAIFQEQMPKALELRATIVGNRVFTASIDSQRSEKTSVDWRRDGLGLLEAWEPYALPSEVENALLKLMHALGLNYGAADFILTPDGRHCFLEVNPVGEFFWLEKCPGLPLSAAIADLLVSNRRGS